MSEMAVRVDEGQRLWSAEDCPRTFALAVLSLAPLVTLAVLEQLRSPVLPASEQVVLFVTEPKFSVLAAAGVATARAEPGESE